VFVSAIAPEGGTSYRVVDVSASICKSGFNAKISNRRTDSSSAVAQVLVALAASTDDCNLLVLDTCRFGEPEHSQIGEVLAQCPAQDLSCGWGITNTRTPAGLTDRYVCSRNTNFQALTIAGPTSRS
jgi:hypothetical protein